MATCGRSLLKAPGWLGLGPDLMVIVGWALTGSAGRGGRLAVVSSALGFVNYLIYERLLARVCWRHL